MSTTTMIERIQFFVEGDPKGQPRPRAFARQIGNKWQARVYEKGTAEEWKSCVAEAARKFIVNTDCPNIRGACRIDLQFAFRRPKSHYRTGRHSHELKPNAPRWHTVKPDTDNLYKAVVDALVRVGLILDDSLVCDHRVTKEYGVAAIGCDVTISSPLGEPPAS